MVFCLYIWAMEFTATICITVGVFALSVWALISHARHVAEMDSEFDPYRVDGIGYDPSTGRLVFNGHVSGTRYDVVNRGGKWYDSDGRRIGDKFGHYFSDILRYVIWKNKL